MYTCSHLFKIYIVDNNRVYKVKLWHKNITFHRKKIKDSEINLYCQSQSSSIYFKLSIYLFYRYLIVKDKKIEGREFENMYF
jgi:hypothetical protein